MKTYINKLFILYFIVFSLALSGCSSNTDISNNNIHEISDDTTVYNTINNKIDSEDNNEDNQIEVLTFDFGTIPVFSGQPFVAINDNKPFFNTEDLTIDAFEYYSDLDSLGRCGVAYANICIDIMPIEKRGTIGQVKPSGWHTVRYDDLISGKYLYNRCHLIGYQLAGENANPKNLITGTRYLNIDGMLPFENLVDDYVDETGNHVLYRVTPYYIGNDLVARGVLMEGLSVEDNGKDVQFCAFVYNNQPGVEIDYSTGDSWRATEKPQIKVENTDGVELPDDTDVYGYIGNIKTKKLHIPTCSKLPKEDNQEFFETREMAIESGYEPCGICKP